MTPRERQRVKNVLVVVAAWGGTALACLWLSGCTDQRTARRVLEQQGYTDIRVGGFDPFACSDDDTYSTKFTATTPYGARVSGVVCSSQFFKGATVRFH